VRSAGDDLFNRLQNVALIVVFEHLRDNLRIGFRYELYAAAHEVLLEVEIILDDAVMHNGKKLTRDGVKFYNADGEPVEKEIEHIEWDIEAAEKGGFEHFMMKEIFEQPKAVRDTITPRIRN